MGTKSLEHPGASFQSKNNLLQLEGRSRSSNRSPSRKIGREPQKTWRKLFGGSEEVVTNRSSSFVFPADRCKKRGSSFFEPRKWKMGVPFSSVPEDRRTPSSSKNSPLLRKVAHPLLRLSFYLRPIIRGRRSKMGVLRSSKSEIED